VRGKDIDCCRGLEPAQYRGDTRPEGYGLRRVVQRRSKVILGPGP
jgi:hypothetical protein